MPLFRRDATGTHAPPWPGGLRWFNSKPLTTIELRGKLILVDFWTYSCVNCIRTLPYLRAWHERYAPQGLVVIGVHAPEFAFEKDAKNVEHALREFAITYPVVQDNDYKIWTAYANAWWPRKLLVDGKGIIVYDHIGEGDYAETERVIQKELVKLGADPAQFPTVMDEHEHGGGGICFPSSSEIYLGTERGRVGNGTGVSDGRAHRFTDVPKHTRDIPYLAGTWSVHLEYIEHAGEALLWDEYLELNFRGTEVNLVMGATGTEPIEVRVTLGGKSPRMSRGKDVGNEDSIMVKETRMYRIIKAKEGMEAELRLLVRDRGLQCYAFTFGGCTD